MTRTLQIAWAAALLSAAAAARAGTLYSETSSGDLSNNQASPTPLTAATGTNSVSGTVGPGDTQDWLAITIPAGDQLSQLILFSYSSTDAQGFMGVQAGTSFSGDSQTASPYLGYTHYGTAAQNGAQAPKNLVGSDLLPLMGDKVNVSPGSQGFTPPLNAGTYTFLIQQLGASTTYQFNFVVTPEPASAGMLGAGLLLLMRRRIR